MAILEPVLSNGFTSGELCCHQVFDDTKLGDEAINWGVGLPAIGTETVCRNGTTGTLWNSTRILAKSCTREKKRSLQWCRPGLTEPSEKMAVRARKRIYLACMGRWQEMEVWSSPLFLVGGWDTVVINRKKRSILRKIHSLLGQSGSGTGCSEMMCISILSIKTGRDKLLSNLLQPYDWPCLA